MKEQEVKLTNLQLLDGVVALGALVQERMPVRSGFAMAVNLKRLRAQMEQYQEYRIEVLKRHAKVGESGDLVIQKEGDKVVFETPEAQAAAETDIADLNDVEVTLRLNVFTLAEIEQTNVQIAPAVWQGLDWMINCEDPQPTNTTKEVAGHRRRATRQK